MCPAATASRARTPEGAAGGELVGVASAVGVADGSAAQHPDGLRAGHLLGERGQGDERGQGRVAGADDGGAPAAEAGDIGWRSLTSGTR